MNGIDWYTARAAGVVAYALLTTGVLLGVLLAGRARLSRWPAFAVTDVHRFVSLLTNLLRKRIGQARWRRVHYLTFGVWIAVTAHGIGAGTDATADWLRVLYLVSIGSVALALTWRVGSRPALILARVPARRGRD